MIIVVGIPSEPPVAMILEALKKRTSDLFVANQREFDLMHIDVEVDERGLSGRLTHSGREIDLSTVSAVYFRIMNEQLLPDLAQEPPLSWRRQHARAITDLLVRWSEVTPARVLNRVSAMASNGSKPYQLRLVRAVGFDVPDTLVTTDPAEVLAFCAQHGRVVYKSTSGQRSIVKEFGDEDRTRLERVRWCPVQFQEYVEGVDVRVHVVGGDVFATRIDSTCVDYRYAHQEGQHATLTAIELKPEIAERCIRATQTLGLLFSGIDLRLATDGRVICFEVNPSPGFSYYEGNTGQPIADAVAQLLIKH